MQKNGKYAGCDSAREKRKEMADAFVVRRERNLEKKKKNRV